MGGCSLGLSTHSGRGTKWDLKGSEGEVGERFVQVEGPAWRRESAPRQRRLRVQRAGAPCERCLPGQ